MILYMGADDKGPQCPRVHPAGLQQPGKVNVGVYQVWQLQ